MMQARIPTKSALQMDIEKAVAALLNEVYNECGRKFIDHNATPEAFDAWRQWKTIITQAEGKVALANTLARLGLMLEEEGD